MELLPRDICTWENLNEVYARNNPRLKCPHSAACTHLKLDTDCVFTTALVPMESSGRADSVVTTTSSVHTNTVFTTAPTESNKKANSVVTKVSSVHTNEDFTTDFIHTVTPCEGDSRSNFGTKIYIYLTGVIMTALLIILMICGLYQIKQRGCMGTAVAPTLEMQRIYRRSSSAM